MKASTCPNCTASVPIDKEYCEHCGTYFDHEKVKEKIEMTEYKSDHGTIRADNVIVYGRYNTIYGNNVIVHGDHNTVYGKYVICHGRYNVHKIPVGSGVAKAFEKALERISDNNYSKYEKSEPSVWVQGLIILFVAYILYYLVT